METALTTKMVIARIIPKAAAYPNSPSVKAVCKRSMGTTKVEFPGPPLVKTYTRSKVLKLPIRRKVTDIAMIGLISGRISENI